MCVAVPPRAARRRTRASIGAVTAAAAAEYNILINKNSITRGVACRRGIKLFAKKGREGRTGRKTGMRKCATERLGRISRDDKTWQFCVPLRTMNSRLEICSFLLRT